jgi:hypothetical protein
VTICLVVHWDGRCRWEALLSLQSCHPYRFIRGAQRMFGTKTDMSMHEAITPLIVPNVAIELISSGASENLSKSSAAKFMGRFVGVIPNCLITH